MNRWFKHHQAIGRRKHRIYLDIYKSDKLTGHQTPPGSSENNWRLRSARSGVIVISSPSTGHSILGGRYSVTISQHHDLSPDCHARAFVFVGRLFRSVRGEGRCPHDTRWCWQAALSGASLRHRHVPVKLSTRLGPQKYMEMHGHYSLLSALILYILEVQTEYYSVQKSSLTRSNIDHGDWPSAGVQTAGQPQSWWHNFLGWRLCLIGLIISQCWTYS